MALRAYCRSLLGVAQDDGVQCHLCGYVHRNLAQRGRRHHQMGRSWWATRILRAGRTLWRVMMPFATTGRARLGWLFVRVGQVALAVFLLWLGVAAILAFVPGI